MNITVDHWDNEEIIRLPIEANEDNQSKKISYKIKVRGKTEEIEKRER